MTFDTLITAEQLQALLATGTPVRLFDCSNDLGNPGAGLATYNSGHIPGALHADLEKDLSAHAPLPAVNGGRHPLPTREAFAERLRAWGLNTGEQVVVYDRQGINYCGRLWWMLKWCGHANVAVLNGGWNAWRAALGPVSTTPPHAEPAGRFQLGEPLVQLVDTDTVARQLGHPTQTVVDARATPRFVGDVEPLDPVAGHIPGALNHPFTQNTDADGFWLPPEKLRALWAQRLAGRDPATVVHHCGSGVTATPNVLAMVLAGYGYTALYAGSWSEWCRTPGLPCARG